MKRPVVHSLLLAFALVLLQACAWNATVPSQGAQAQSVKPVPVEPPFMRGFSRISDKEHTAVGALAYEDRTVFGSGVLISSCHVLTAAHCVDDKDKPPYWFICGGEFYVIRSATIHPLNKIEHIISADIAVLQLEKPCTVTPAPLLENGYWLTRGEDLTVVGYGGGIRRCSNPGVVWYYGTMLEDLTVFKMLPLKGTVWFGDSGGAVYNSNGVLVGIVSSLGFARGHLFENSAVRLDFFRSWILQTLEATPCQN